MLNKANPVLLTIASVMLGTMIFAFLLIVMVPRATPVVSENPETTVAAEGTARVQPGTEDGAPVPDPAAPTDAIPAGGIPGTPFAGDASTQGGLSTRTESAQTSAQPSPVETGERGTVEASSPIFQGQTEPGLPGETTTPEGTTVPEGAPTTGAAAGTLVAAGNPANGDTLYSVNCQGCHGAGGAGGAVGPNLVQAGSVPSWALAEFATSLREGVSPNGPLAPTMPRYSEAQLSDSDVGDLYAYLNAQAN